MSCLTDRRRQEIRAHQSNGVDAVEVGDDGLTLTVTFIGHAPDGLTEENVRIDGGRRIVGIEAREVSVERGEDPELDDRLRVTLDRTGDTSRYRLSIVDGDEPFPGLDQRYYQAEFVFRPGCPTPFDGDDEPYETEPAKAPVIDYTARDYDTLRQLLLDRLALTSPGWTERNPADLGVTLVELLAYTGDQISYQQDAVATEAYLDTARRRVSVRRHVRLIDYPMHDGCNARVLIALEAAEPVTLEPGTYRFAAIDDEQTEVFEPLTEEPLTLHPAHNTIRLWTWGDEQCALERGATTTTLRDEWVDDEHTGAACA